MGGPRQTNHDRLQRVQSIIVDSGLRIERITLNAFKASDSRALATLALFQSPEVFLRR